MTTQIMTTSENQIDGEIIFTNNGYQMKWITLQGLYNIEEQLDQMRPKDMVQAVLMANALTEVHTKQDEVEN
jgi:hypothetical protein